ncbi:MAG: hypothetical protein U0998_10145 [Moraxellaceae bacterium]|nr:hypothetical protein [Moraxellaceae bacterium]MDZ4387534.1 hypothetical protein [Moraxellaceae bacterium]
MSVQYFTRRVWRARLKIVVNFCFLIGITVCVPAWASFIGGNVSTVTIKTVDSNGAPIPWVTIGASWTPYPPLNEEEKYWPRLKPEDLKRLLFRNPEAWEYWNSYNRPVMYLKFSGMTNQNGELQNRIDYIGEAGRGSQWPAELTVTYGAYRHGVLPITGQVKLHQKSRGIEITLVMAPEPNHDQQMPDYLKTYYEIKHELTDWRRNEGISLKNYERLENFRQRLIEAAKTAFVKGDSQSAARIMYWVAYMPEVTLSNGKPNGFAQTTESLRNYEAIKKAAEYDPNNPHIQAQSMLYEGWWWNHENDAKRISYEDVKRHRRAWLDRAVALDKVAGTRLWAKFHQEIANTYGFFDMHADEIVKLEWLKSYDPSWRIDIDDRIKRIKRRVGKS